MPYQESGSHQDSLLTSSNDFRLDRQTYLDYVHTSRNGDLTFKRHNNVNVVFIGPDYYKFQNEKSKVSYTHFEAVSNLHIPIGTVQSADADQPRCGPSPTQT